MFLVKEVSRDLGITPQAIYNKKKELQDKGFMYRNKLGDWEISADGYNYLKEKRENSLIKFNKPFEYKEEKPYNANTSEQLNLIEEFKSQLEDKKKEVEEWKNRYDSKEKEYIEYRNKQQLLLEAGEEERRKASERMENMIKENAELRAINESMKNRGFFARIFNRF